MGKLLRIKNVITIKLNGNNCYGRIRKINRNVI